MKRIIMSLLCLFIASTVSWAQEAIAGSMPLSLTGSVDAYYRSSQDAPATSFANLPGFALGMVNVVAAHNGEKAGFVGDLVFGPRGADAVFGSTGSASIVNQLYAYLNVSDHVRLTLGNFNTFLGYEVISPTANFNYSTSYMFSYGPFSHTGLKADFSLNGGWSLMLGVFNETDATEYQPIGANYYGGAQLAYAFDGGGAWLNTLYTDGFFQIDLTAGVDLSDQLYLGLNATNASDAFSGAAVYLQLATSDSFKLGARVEYFDDQTVTNIDSVDPTGPLAGGSVVDFTISANYTVGNLKIIPEFRVDSYSDDRVDRLSAFTLAVVYGF